MTVDAATLLVPALTVRGEPGERFNRHIHRSCPRIAAAGRSQPMELVELGTDASAWCLGCAAPLSTMASTWRHRTAPDLQSASRSLLVVHIPSPGVRSAWVTATSLRTAVPWPAQLPGITATDRPQTTFLGVTDPPAARWVADTATRYNLPWVAAHYPVPDDADTVLLTATADALIDQRPGPPDLAERLTSVLRSAVLLTCPRAA